MLHKDEKNYQNEKKNKSHPGVGKIGSKTENDSHNKTIHE